MESDSSDNEEVFDTREKISRAMQAQSSNYKNKYENSQEESHQIQEETNNQKFLVDDEKVSSQELTDEFKLRAEIVNQNLHVPHFAKRRSDENTPKIVVGCKKIVLKDVLDTYFEKERDNVQKEIISWAQRYLTENAVHVKKEKVKEFKRVAPPVKKSREIKRNNSAFSKPRTITRTTRVQETIPKRKVPKNVSVTDLVKSMF